MELNEFIKDVTNDIYHKLQLANEKLLMQDIIMIYNGCFNNYKHYKDTVTEGNNRLNKVELTGLSFCIHPRHIILDEEIYNFIKDLRKCYNG